MNKFTLTISQIADIFLAGINRGSEEECCFQSGCGAPSKRKDSFVNAVYEAINGDVSILDEDHIDIFVVEEWLKDFKI